MLGLLQACEAGLTSKAWTDAIAALNTLRQLTVHHPDVIRPSLCEFACVGNRSTTARWTLCMHPGTDAAHSTPNCTEMLRRARLLPLLLSSVKSLRSVQAKASSSSPRDGSAVRRGNICGDRKQLLCINSMYFNVAAADRYHGVLRHVRKPARGDAEPDEG